MYTVHCSTIAYNYFLPFLVFFKMQFLLDLKFVDPADLNGLTELTYVVPTPVSRRTDLRGFSSRFQVT